MPIKIARYDLTRTSSYKYTVIGLGFSLLTVVSTFAAEVNYSLHETIPISGDGGWDYASVDSAGRRLYVSHANKAIVIDLDANTVVGEITNTPGFTASPLRRNWCSLRAATAR